MSKPFTEEEIRGNWEPEGFAKGGYVDYDPEKVDSIVQSLRNYESSEDAAPVEKFARGGAVEYNPSTIETLAYKLREELHG